MDTEENVPVLLHSFSDSGTAADFFNPIMMAKTSSSLAKALDVPFGLGDGEIEHPGPARFEKIDAALLQKSIYLDPFARWDGGKFVAKGLGAKKDASKESALNPQDVFDETHVEALSLLDVTIERNLVSIALRASCAMRTAPQSPLEAAGFVYSGYLSGSWAIPVSSNPTKLGIDGHMRSSVKLWPNFARIAKLKRSKLGSYIYWHLINDEDIVFAPAVDLFDESSEFQDGLWFLVLVGEDQRELSNKLVNGIDSAVDLDLVATGRLGSELMRADGDGLFQRLWSEAVSHEGRYACACAVCGRVQLTSLVGQPKRFCSSSCRSIWAKRNAAQ